MMTHINKFSIESYSKGLKQLNNLRQRASWIIFTIKTYQHKLTVSLLMAFIFTNKLSHQGSILFKFLIRLWDTFFLNALEGTAARRVELSAWKANKFSRSAPKSHLLTIRPKEDFYLRYSNERFLPFAMLFASYLINILLQWESV